MSNLIDFQEFFKIFIKKYKIFNESSILAMKIKVQMRFDVSQSKKSLKFAQFNTAQNWFLVLKYHFCSDITHFGAVSIIVRCGIPYTQRNHNDNIITNSCKLICNIPGSGTNLEFHLVSQDVYLLAKWFGFYYLIFARFCIKTMTFCHNKLCHFFDSPIFVTVHHFHIFVTSHTCYNTVTPYHPNVLWGVHICLIIFQLRGAENLFDLSARVQSKK